MKHSARVTCWLVGVFVVTQIIGLLIISQYLDVDQSRAQQEATWEALPLVERPEVENESTSWLPLIVAILIGTALVLLIIKFNVPWILKVWFGVVVGVTLTFAFAAFMPTLIALTMATVLALWRSLKPNPWVHNVTELFIYGGLAAMIVPLLNVKAGLVFLFCISIYDMIAVWKMKHMVHMAQFQTENKTFAGLFIPYEKGTMSAPKKTKNTKLVKAKVAVLGGGDVGFPLIFAGTVFKELILTESLRISFGLSLLVSLGATIALALLLTYGKPDKFYPAMPFISLGAVAGYLLVLLF